MEAINSIALGLGAMIGIGLASALSKPLSEKYGAVHTIFIRQILIASALVVLALPAFGQVRNWQALPWVIALGVFGYLPLVAFFTALKLSPVGLVAPIAGASPFITVLLNSYFLHIPMRPLQGVAIGIIIAANIAISLRSKNLQDHNPAHYQGVPFAILACLGWGIFFFLYAQSARELGPWVAPAINEAIILLVAGAHTLALKNSYSLRQSLQRSVIIPALLISVGSLFFTFGAKYAQPSIFMPIAQSTAAVGVLAGVWLYQEHLSLQQRLATVVMIVGVAILAIP